jgi:hypothetical protein
MKIISIFCLFLLIMGCTPTLKEIQCSVPKYSLTSDIPPKALANKISYQATIESMNSRFFPNWDPVKATEIDGIQKIIITVTSRNNILLIPYSPQPIAEITIFPNKSGGSKIEYKVANRWVDKDNFWNIIKQCASNDPYPQKAAGK